MRVISRFICVSVFLLGCKLNKSVETRGADVKATITAGGFGLDVNDVSYLFPLSPSGEPVPNIKLSDRVKNAEILPQAMFDAAIQHSETKTGMRFDAVAKQRSNWRIYAFRFDPCAPTANLRNRNFGPGPLAAMPCDVQFRLIAQPVGSGGNTIDNAMHLVFRIGLVSVGDGSIEQFRSHFNASPAKGILDELVSMKDNDTNGRPLGVHPILANAAKTQGLQAKIRSLLSNHLTNEQLLDFGVAVMGLETPGFEPWVFAPIAFRNGLATPGIGVPTLNGAASMKLSFVDAKNVIPSPTQAVSTAPLFENSNDISLAHQVDHPIDSHFFNRDCVSCHTATTRMIQLQQVAPNSSRFVYEEVHNKTGVSGYLSPEVVQENNWNVRNFGYFGKNATITTRTLTETIEVVVLANEILQAKNPGLNCGTNRAQLDSVWVKSMNKQANAFSGCTVESKTVEANTVSTPPPNVAVVEPPLPTIPQESIEQACRPNRTEGGRPARIVPSTDSVSFVFSGGDSRCLSRIFNGPFKQMIPTPSLTRRPLSLSCSSVNQCSLTSAGSSSNHLLMASNSFEVSGDLAKQFQNKPTSGGVLFQSVADKSSGGQPKVTIACASGGQCTITWVL